MLAAFVYYAFLFVALLVLPALLVLIPLLFLRQGKHLWVWLKPVIQPVARTLARSEFVRGLGARFPGSIRFATHRLDPRQPWGLSATLAAAVIFVGLWFFLGVLQDLWAKDPLVALDIRIHNSVPLFRTPWLTSVMLVVTELGGATVLTLVCLGVSLLALASARQRLAATYVFALGSAAIVSVTLKVIFGSQRPVDGIINVQEASFPSGHLLSGTVVYGLLAVLLLEGRGRPVLRALGVTLLLLVIVGIGLSRLYLGVHWPSDLLGSLAVALIVLAVSLFFLHYGSPIPWIDSFEVQLDRLFLYTIGICALVWAVGISVLRGETAKTIPVKQLVATRVLELGDFRTFPANFPRWSEDLIGQRMEPVSLIIVGSYADVQQSFTRAGWALADPPTPLRVLEEGIAALRNLPDPTGPATPAFVMDRPQAFTFERPDPGSPSVRRRHHTRVWQTLHCLAPQCRPLWVATSSFDVDLELAKDFYFPTHRIDPAIDRERALVVDGLGKGGALNVGTVVASPPVSGNNAAGDPFKTDGRAVILILPERP